MKYLLLVGLLLGSLCLSAQPQNAFRWANQVPLNYPGLATDAAGNTVVTGSFSQPISANGQTVVPYGLEDVFVGKYSAGGQLLWFTHIGGAGATARGTDVALDAAGNSYVTGGFTGTLTQNVAGTPLTMSASPFAGSYTLPFLLKISSNGQPLWARQGKDTGASIQSTSGLRVTADLLGNATVTGYGTSLLTFGNITLGGNRAAFLVHYDAAGTVKWGHTLSSSLATATRGIGTDAVGNTYLTIRPFGLLFIDGQPVAIPELTSVVLAKFSGSSGTLLWKTAIKGAEATIENTDVAVDLVGHTTLIGSFSGTTRFGSRNLTTSSAAEIYAARYNPNGSLDWARSLGTQDPFSARIATNATGSSVVALVSSMSTPTHSQLLDLNPQSGATTWRHELGPGTTSGSNLAVSPAEQVYVAGSFSGRLELGRTTLTSTDGAYFLARIDRGPGSNLPRFADLISYYPNPITAYLKLKLPAQCLPAHASVLHMSGREVLSQPIVSGETELNVRSLKPGLYTLRLQLPDGPVTKQIQIK
jgi:hypothetical protein